MISYFTEAITKFNYKKVYCWRCWSSQKWRNHFPRTTAIILSSFTRWIYCLLWMYRRKNSSWAYKFNMSKWFMESLAPIMWKWGNFNSVLNNEIYVKLNKHHLFYICTYITVQQCLGYGQQEGQYPVGHTANLSPIIWWIVGCCHIPLGTVKTQFNYKPNCVSCQNTQVITRGQYGIHHTPPTRDLPPFLGYKNPCLMACQHSLDWCQLSRTNLEDHDFLLGNGCADAPLRVHS